MVYGNGYRRGPPHGRNGGRDDNSRGRGRGRGDRFGNNRYGRGGYNSGNHYGGYGNVERRGGWDGKGRNSSKERGYNTNAIHIVEREREPERQKDQPTSQPANKYQRTLSAAEEESPSSDAEIQDIEDFTIPKKNKDNSMLGELDEENATPRPKTRKEEIQDMKDEMRKLRMQERIAYFLKLSYEERLSILMPENINIESIPPMTRMQNEEALFETTIQQIKATTIKRLFPDKKAEQSDDDSIFSQKSSDSSFFGVPTSAAAESEAEKHTRFLSRLPYCTPLFIGFQASFLSSHGNKNWCYCPCSKYMKEWKDLFGVDDIVEDAYSGNHQKSCKSSGNNTKMPMAPSAILQHLGRINTSDDLHTITCEFLEELYKNYHAPGVKHIAFCHPNTPECLQAEKLQAEQTASTFAALRLQLEEAHRAQAEQQREQERLAELEKVNKDQYNELSILRDMKKKMGFQDIDEMENATVSPAMREMYSQSIKNAIVALKKQYGGIGRTTEIKLNQGFKLGETLKKWANSPSKDKVGLFAEVKWSNKGGCPQLQNLINPWEIVYTDGIIKKKSSLPKDEGGPTRDFFNRVWTQVGDLKYDIDDKKSIKLFERCEDGYCATSDEMINHLLENESDEEKKNAIESIKKIYRVFGRIMAHCVIGSSTRQDENSPPLSIGAQALPNLFRNILFRSIQPQDEIYGASSLLDHAFHLLKNDTEEQYKSSDDVFAKAGVDTGGSFEEKATAFRSAIQDLYAEGRTIALDAMREGLTLGGSFQLPTALMLVPLAEISSRFFAKPSVKASDFLYEDRSHRILRATLSEVVPPGIDVERFAPKQESLMAGIADMIVEEDLKETDFLSKFITFCTGQSYIPDLDCHKFSITIEFNFDEGLGDDFIPAAHTCINLLKIPGSAYGGDVKKFKERFEKSLQFGLTSFDMK